MALGNGTAAAGGFYVGIVDDVTPQLKKMTRAYESSISRILDLNTKLQRSFDDGKKLMRANSAAGFAGGLQAAHAARQGSDKRGWQFSLSSLPGAGLFRQIFGGLQKRESTQKFKANLTPFAKGGIAKRPTAALIGEAGAEAVAPLSELAKMIRGQMAVVFARVGMAGPNGPGTGVDQRVASKLANKLIVNTDSIKDLLKFLQIGMKEGHTLQQDALSLARVMVRTGNLQFKDFGEMGRYVQRLKRELVPTIASLRGETDKMAKSVNSPGRGKSSARSMITGLGLQSALSGINRGLTAVSEFTGSVGILERSVDMAKQRGVTLAAASTVTRDIQKSSKVGLMNAEVSEVLKALPQGVSLALTENQNMVRAATEQVATFGVDADAASKQMLHLSNYLKMGADAAGDFASAQYSMANDLGLILDTPALTTQTTELAIVLRGLGKTGSAAKKALTGFSGAAAAVADKLNNTKFGDSLSELLGDPEKLLGVSASLGLNANDVLADPSLLLKSPAIAGAAEALRNAVQGGDVNAMRGAGAQMKGIGNGLFDNFSPTDLNNFAINYNKIIDDTKKATSALSAMGKQGEAVTALAAKEGGFTTFQRTMSAAATQTTVAGHSFAQFVDIINNSGVIKLGQGVLGLATVFDALRKSTWLATAAQAAWNASSGLFSKIIPGMIGRIWGWVSGVGASAAATATAATAASVSTAGFGASLGAFGVAAAPAIPIIWTIAGAIFLVSAALGTLAVGIGYALKLAAPFIEVLVKGLVQMFQIFSAMDPLQMLAIGPAFAAIGIGLAAMAAGVVAAVGILAAADFANGFASFFGFGSGMSITDTIKAFVQAMAPLGASLNQLSGLPSKITLPVPVFAGSYEDAVKTVQQAQGLYAKIADMSGQISAVTNRPIEVRGQQAPSADDILRVASETSILGPKQDEVVMLLGRIAKAVEAQVRKDDGNPLLRVLANGGLG